jgi:biopolymer transport protein ExbB
VKLWKKLLLTTAFIFVVGGDHDTLIAQTTDAAETVTATAADDGRQIVASKRLLDIVRNGGPLMIPIGICSFILLVFVFERSISLRKARILPPQFVKRFIKNISDGKLSKEQALEQCEKNRSPISKVFQAGVIKWGRPSVEVEQAVLDAGERAATDLRRFMRMLNGIATVCPLLGLLGTVFGMIHAFDAIASVSPTLADPKVLIATGISQALLTTAAGMSVAIPALIAYMYFASRIDQRVVEIDAAGQKLVNLISAEAIAHGSIVKKATRNRKTKAA